ncbi:MAG: rhomboid family intramembrane serine protease [Phycisphaerales bacterium]
MIPLTTDRPQKRPATVNTALVIINVVIAVIASASSEVRFFLDVNANLFSETMPVFRDPYNPSLFEYGSPHLWQFFTYQFLHADAFHLLGNMLFLWVFGAAVEDRFGHLAYLLFYLTAGVIAGVGHVLTSAAPVLGASGAVAGVTGAFLVLFPKTHIRVLWLFFMIGIIEIPSLWFIGASFALDVYHQIDGAGRVAYMAHIAGTLFGVAIAGGLLFSRILAREPYDLVSLVTQWNRRRKFSAMTQEGFDPWAGKTKSRRGPERRSAEAKKTGKSARPAPPPPDPAAIEAAQARTEIADALNAGDIEAAAARYRRLLDEAPQSVLSQERQLEIGNHFFSAEQYEYAARAYRLLLDTYPTADPHGQIRLMLGLIRVRYAPNPEEAQEALKVAVERLPGESDQALARELLTELNE